MPPVNPMPYLGQRVLFFDPYLPREHGATRIPRLALITGLCERPSTVHLTIFNEPEQDVRQQGMGPVTCRQQIVFCPQGAALPGPTVPYCVPADDLVPAGSVNPNVVGTIDREPTRIGPSPEETYPDAYARETTDTHGSPGVPTPERVYEPVNDGPHTGEPVIPKLVTPQNRPKPSGRTSSTTRVRRTGAA